MGGTFKSCVEIPDEPNHFVLKCELFAASFNLGQSFFILKGNHLIRYTCKQLFPDFIEEYVTVLTRNLEDNLPDIASLGIEVPKGELMY